MPQCFLLIILATNSWNANRRFLARLLTCMVFPVQLGILYSRVTIYACFFACFQLLCAVSSSLFYGLHTLLERTSYRSITICEVAGFWIWHHAGRVLLHQAYKEHRLVVQRVGSPYSFHCHTIMKFIVSVGWSIYPAGYFFGYLIFNHSDDAALNLIYNLADFVNKIAFCLAIWQCAKADTAMKSK